MGIKYNRSKKEYPVQVLKDFYRFQEDRIRTVMIALPWSEWEPREGELDPELLKSSLHEVLKFCEARGIRVVLSAHCIFWGKSGDWSIPGWVQRRPGYGMSANVLRKPEFQEAYISFLKRLIDATRGYAAVTGYNILNEPVASTAWYLNDPEGRRSFDVSWEGVLHIAASVREHMKETGVKQALMFGSGYSDPGFESFLWENNGARDLRPLWTEMMDRISAQSAAALNASVRWYPDRARVRTEGALNYMMLDAWRKSGDVLKIETRWSKESDLSVATYDYDGAYDYEGLANAAVPGMEAFYVWRVGSIDNDPDFVGLLGRQQENLATPYYAALRDLASGVDSFEALGGLPENGKQGLAFDPEQATATVSRRWTGSGSVTGQKAQLPPGDVQSRVAGRVVLGAGQSVFRTVVPVHWKDNGVTASDSFTFWGYADRETEIQMAVHAGGKILRRKLVLEAGVWRRYLVSFEALGLTEALIGAVTEAGFENPSKKEAVFLVDDYLIRAE